MVSLPSPRRLLVQTGSVLATLAVVGVVVWQFDGPDHYLVVPAILTVTVAWAIVATLAAAPGAIANVRSDAEDGAPGGADEWDWGGNV